MLVKKNLLYFLICLCISCQTKDKGYFLHKNSIQYWDVWNINDSNNFLKSTAYSYSFHKKGECLTYSWYETDAKDSVERVRNDNEHSDIVKPKIWEIHNDTINIRGRITKYQILNSDSVFLIDMGQMLILSPMQKEKGLPKEFKGRTPLFR